MNSLLWRYPYNVADESSLSNHRRRLYPRRGGAITRCSGEIGVVVATAACAEGRLGAIIYTLRYAEGMMIFVSHDCRRTFDIVPEE